MSTPRTQRGRSLPLRPHFTYHGRGEAPTFALAATLALLKAHGCEVGE